MPLYRPRELSEFLTSINRKAHKGLSQNFLIDRNVLQRILDTIPPPPANIVEIGPGPGVLTEELLHRNYRVLAVEKDIDFAHHLSRLDPTGKLLTTVSGDVREISLASYGLLPRQTAIVSNLPYHITSSILQWLLQERFCFSQATLMMQREVATKMRNMGSSAIQVELSLGFVITPIGKVPRGCFTPVPHVDSEIMLLTTRTDLPKRLVENTIRIIRTAFAHRRKSLVSSLSDLYDRTHISQCCAQTHLSLQSRPHELSLEDWTELSSQLEPLCLQR